MTLSTILLWFLAALFLAAIFVAGYFVLVTRRIAAEAERRVPPAGKFIDVDGNRIHYVDEGEGRPIVFVHGLGAQLLQFRHPLFDRLDGFRLIALDRPGSGYSSRAAGATGRLTEQALMLRHFIEKLGLEKPLIVGHSLGGAITLALALDHPDTISGIALMSPLTHLSEAPPEFQGLLIRSPLKRWLLANTVAVPMAMKYAQQTLNLIFGPQAVPGDYIVKGGGMLGLRPSHIYATSTDFVVIEQDLGRLQARYGEIRLPAGLLFGTGDRVLDYRIQGLPMQGKIPGLEIELLDGIGHMPQFTATTEAVAFIRKMADRAFAS
ncbi:alpha/beta hydrolase [Mesorhizobium sp. CGMCC 1.15528]|uniref:Alpha/beta hydrolase n=1 Tax=Mesorhizobium zhangyense TaxID=1776730 RepID=A0A7C9VAJ0_9HYPH|nr:alpha/beta hydrolase [Mesorhizobium zhangyense]NGN39708.1 alpha/beta hydrolase [Mesorhizobium zhangyense]